MMLTIAARHCHVPQPFFRKPQELLQLSRRVSSAWKCRVNSAKEDGVKDLPRDQHDAMWQQIVEVVRAALLADRYALRDLRILRG